MNVHENARTTRHGRMLMIERLQAGWSVAAVAEGQGVTVRTVRKWRDRFADKGEAGLADRSSRPHRSPTRLAGQAEEQIERLRRQRMTGPAIARQLNRPLSTIGVVLRRRGLGRLAALDPRPPVIRYQREQPGELIHIDIKKLGRIARPSHRVTSNRRDSVEGIGWEHLHVAVDDASRLAYTELLANEQKKSATGFLDRALAWFARHGVVVQRVMTDNGSAYRSKLFARSIAAHGLRHIRTRPYTPRTNGKAERFIQSSLREWAYARTFQTSAERGAAMLPWINNYNHIRPHSALGGKPPISRIARNNLLGNDSSHHCGAVAKRSRPRALDPLGS